MLALTSILQEKAFEEIESCFNLNFAHSNALSIDEVHLRNNKNRYELHRPHAGPLLHQIVTKLFTSLLETMLLFFTNFFFSFYHLSVMM